MKNDDKKQENMNFVNPKKAKKREWNLNKYMGFEITYTIGS